MGLTSNVFLINDYGSSKKDAKLESDVPLPHWVVCINSLMNNPIQMLNLMNKRNKDFDLVAVDESKSADQILMTWLHSWLLMVINRYLSMNLNVIQEINIRLLVLYTAT